MRPKVAVVYHMFPHYRAGILSALSQSQRYDYVFVAGKADMDGVKALDGSAVTEIVDAPIYTSGPFLWQPSICRLALCDKFEAMIFLGNPYFISTWLAAATARIRGIRTLIWAHGWLRREGLLKRTLRRWFFHLGDVVLVYGNRARQLGVQEGFPGDRVEVIYNSLDLDASNRVFSKLETGVVHGSSDPRTFFSNKSLPLIICTARLITLCQFDLLFEAAEILARKGSPINILLVGDGPERVRLESLATDLGLNVYFLGACYDESVLGQLIYHSDITVSPGKIGLAAIHSLTYGTPAITHSDLDRQMPEVEAIEPGVTGLLFEKNNPVDLANKMHDWISSNRDREAVRKACRATILTTWNAENQRRLIEAALDKLLGSKWSH